VGRSARSAGWGCQLPDERRAESRQDPPVAEPCTQPVRLGFNDCLGIAADVFEQAHDDLAVRALSPAADDAAVPPDRRSRVAGAIEQCGAVSAQVPIAPGPTHDGRIEARKQGGKGFRPVGWAEVVSERDPRGAVEIDFGRSNLSERAPDLAQGPAGPPAHILHRCGSEGFEPPADELDLGLVDRPFGQRLAQPALGR